MADANGLAARLTAIAAQIDWPVTPNLAPVVTRRLATTPRWYERRWVMAAAAALLIAALLLAYTPSRDAIADFLNLHTILNRVNQLPTPSPLPSGPLGRRLGLGHPVTLATARASVRWTVVLPAGLGAPDEVYLSSPGVGPPEGEVTLVYASRPGIPVAGQTGVSLLVTEVRGTVDEHFFGKITGQGTTIEEIAVNGHRGWWISGAPHIFFFLDSDGQMREETMRLATNTLLLDDNGTIVRIEGNLTRQQALALAASLA